MLKWYVLKENSATRKVEPYNVLANWDDTLKKLRKKCKTKDEFKALLKREFMYYYWSKAECEILVCGLFNNSEEHIQKIDIWSQLEPNLDIITDYIISTLKFRF